MIFGSCIVIVFCIDCNYCFVVVWVEYYVFKESCCRMDLVFVFMFVFVSVDVFVYVVLEFVINDV